MENKKTAVEWLEEQLIKEGIYISKELYNQAKQIEKEQIIDAFMNGADVGDMFNNEGRAFITDAEQYYDQTFK